MSSAVVIDMRPMDPSNASDVEELRIQRRLCGWDEDQVGINMSAVAAGDMVYFFFYLCEDPQTVIGSGGLDLNGIQNGQSMASHANAEFCIMGLFLHER